jgi:signal transduction histidine kinase
MNKSEPNQYMKKYLSIRWQIVLIILPIAIIPLLLFVFFSSRNTFKYLERQGTEFYNEILIQVANNCDFVFEQYARTFANIMEIPEVVYWTNVKPYSSVTEENLVSRAIMGEEGYQGGLRDTIEEKVDGAAALVEMDRKSLLTNTDYKVHTVSPGSKEVNYDRLFDDPLFLKIKRDNSQKIVLGKLQDGVISGFEAEKRSAFIFPYYPTPPENENDTFQKFLIVIMFSDFIQNFYNDINKLNLGTLYILDSMNNILSVNHPGDDDYYDFDEQKGQYILGDDELNDPDEIMSFRDYQILNTDSAILENRTVQKMIDSLDSPENSVDNPVSEYENSTIVKHNGINYLTIVNSTESSGLKLVFFQPVNFINKPILNMMYVMLFIVSTIIVFIIFFSLILSNSLTKPIKELTNAASLVGEGKYTINKIPIKSHNEIGMLTNVFNNMVSKIRDYTYDLENIVAERTELLEHKSSELKLSYETLMNTNKELIKANKSLQENTRFKSQYLANMSHDIRTPLNSIMGFNQLLMLKNFEVKNDIIEINHELIDLIEHEPVLKESEVNYWCTMFASVTNIDEEGLKYFYYNGLKKIYERLDKSKMSKDIRKKSDALLKEAGDLLKEEDEVINNSLEYSHKSGNYLLQLINTILDIAKIESGKMELHLKEHSLKDFIRDLIKMAESYRKTKEKEDKITLERFVDADVPETWKFDKIKIKQVLLNLISNAIKFTMFGTITIKVSVTDKGSLQFTVTDTGLGIKKEEKEVLFKEFARSSTARNIEGTGLGLALSKKIVELHGGTITVKSEFRKGSTFSITIADNLS